MKIVGILVENAGKVTLAPANIVIEADTISVEPPDLSGTGVFDPPSSEEVAVAKEKATDFSLTGVLEKNKKE